MNLILKSVSLVFLALISSSSALADCGTGSLFAINPNQTYAAMKPTDADSKILVWNIATGKATELADPKMYVQEIYFTDDTHLLAIGSSNSYGPLYRKWDLTDGSVVSFQNQKFRDFSDAKTNFSQNKRYAVTSTQLAFGGWGYMAIDLETGKDIYTIKLSKGQGQISNDAKTLYYTENYYQESRDGRQSPLEWVKLSAVDTTTSKQIFSIPLNTFASDYSGLGWAEDSLILYDSKAIAFNTKTNLINNPPYMGPLLDWSKDFSVRVSGDRLHSGTNFFNIAGTNPARFIEIRSPHPMSVVKLSLDSKKVATISYSAEIYFYDAVTGAKTAAPACQK